MDRTRRNLLASHVPDCHLDRRDQSGARLREGSQLPSLAWLGWAAPRLRLGEYYLTSMRVLERGRWHAAESAADGDHRICGTPLAHLAAMYTRQRPCSLAGDAWGPHNPCWQASRRRFSRRGGRFWHV